MKKDISIYFDVIESLKTTQEVANFLSEIDVFLLTFFKSEKISIEQALSSVSADSAQKISQAFSKNNLDINDKDTVTGFFKNLKELAGKLNVIKLTLAFDPTAKTVENIHNFVKENIGTGYILEIEVEPDILGGSIIIFNGKYNDFSLKKSIEEVFKGRNIQTA